MEYGKIIRYATSPLLTAHGIFTCHVYRDSLGLEHVALVAGEVNEKRDVLCRVHSECMTSEVFGSLRCDCKAQLDLAMQRIQEAEQGVILYLRQEGRGIGLGNKIRTYAAQARGSDTVDANLDLGFPEDAREYDVAGAILKDLGILSAVLMTNNPAKLKGLEMAGIVVSRRQEHVSRAAKEADAYLTTKRRRLGHLL